MLFSGWKVGILFVSARENDFGVAPMAVKAHFYHNLSGVSPNLNAYPAFVG